MHSVYIYLKAMDKTQHQCFPHVFACITRYENERIKEKELSSFIDDDGGGAI